MRSAASNLEVERVDPLCHALVLRWTEDEVYSGFHVVTIGLVPVVLNTRG